MGSINEQIRDQTTKTGLTYFNLTSNRDLSIIDTLPPVLWSGYINNDKFALKWIGGEFNQISSYEIIESQGESIVYVSRLIKQISDHYNYLN